MAKLLISCDNTLRRVGDKYYFKAPEWRDLYYRYLRVFDNIKIIVRCVDSSSISSQYILIDNPCIDIVYIPEFSGPIAYARKYQIIGNCIKSSILDCDAAVFRLPSTIAQRVAHFWRYTGKPYAVEVVFDAMDGWKSEFNIINKILWMKMDLDMRRTCYRADGVSCVTESYLQKRYYSRKSNCFVSHYSTLDLPKSFYLSERKYPESRTIVLANVANQVQYNGRKGFYEIILALALLKSRGIIIHAKFVGKDYHKGVSKFKKLINKLGITDQVEFLGYLSRSELDHFLSTVDMFVMPTRAEGLPRVVIEAMAKGLPVITTPVSGNPELVEEHFLVEYNDINKLADRIQELASDKELYESTSRNNYLKSKNYEYSILQNRRDEFYRNLLEITK